MAGSRDRRILDEICSLLPELSESELKVLIDLATRARDTQGSATVVPVATIYRETGLSRRSVNRAIKNLTAKNLLAVHPQHGSRGQYLPNVYYPLLQVLVTEAVDLVIEGS